MLLGRKEIFPASICCCGHPGGKAPAMGVRRLYFSLASRRTGIELVLQENELNSAVYDVDTPLAVPTQASQNLSQTWCFLERQLTHPLKMFADAASESACFRFWLLGCLLFGCVLNHLSVNMESITNDAMMPSFFACSGSEAFCGETTDEAKGVEEEFSAETFSGHSAMEVVGYGKGKE